MKKYFYLLILVMFSTFLNAQKPHPAIAKLENVDGSFPEFITYTAYITARPENVLTETSGGCRYFADSGNLQIQCGTFSSWEAGEVVHLEVESESGNIATGEVTLTWSGFDYFLPKPLILTVPIPTEWSVSGIVSEGGTGLESTSITYEIIDPRKISKKQIYRKNTKEFQHKVKEEHSVNKNRSTTIFTNSSGEYQFIANDSIVYKVTPTKSGYYFEPESHQAIITSNIDDWDFIAMMNQETPPANGNADNGDPVVVVPEPVEIDGSLANTQVDVDPENEDDIVVSIVVANSNDSAPIPENVDLSFEIEVSGSTGPSLLTLHFPIVVPAISTISVYNGVRWDSVAGADWSISGQVTFSYDFSLIRGIGTFVVGSGSTLPVELSSFTVSVLEIEDKDVVSLRWVTQSETNVLGYSIYRSEIDDLSSSIRLNNTIISATNTSIEHIYSFNDEEYNNDVDYYYWLESKDLDGYIETFGPVNVKVESDPENSPDLGEINFLYSNYPNPFNPTTTIQFELIEEHKVKLEIFNVKGQRVKTIFAGKANSGLNEFIWNGTDNSNNEVGSGVYYYRLVSPNYREIRKMLLIK